MENGENVFLWDQIKGWYSIITVNSNNIYDSIYIKIAMFPCDLNFDRFLKINVSLIIHLN